jgi:hypothetical protein
MVEKSEKLELWVLFDEKSGRIKMAGKGLTASSISGDPASKRYHPNLYRKIAEFLRAEGKPAPSIEQVNTKGPK